MFTQKELLTMEDRIRQTITSYFMHLCTQDGDKWVENFASDAIVHDPVGQPPHNGHDDLKRFLEGIGGLFEWATIAEDSIHINGLEAAVRWVGKGVGKNKREVVFSGIDVFTFNDQGKIQYLKCFWDAGRVLSVVTEGS